MIQSSNELEEKRNQITNGNSRNDKKMDSLRMKSECRRKMDEFEMETKRYDILRQTVYKKIRMNMAEMEREIDELFHSGQTDTQLEEIRKRRRRNNDKVLLRKVSMAEAIEDLNEIRGIRNTLYVNVENGVLKIDNQKIKKRDNVKVEMYGETFRGNVMTITSKTVTVKNKNGKKYNISIQSIKKKDVNIMKINK